MPRNRWSDDTSPDSGEVLTERKLPSSPDPDATTRRTYPFPDVAPKSMRSPTDSAKPPISIEVQVLPQNYPVLIRESEGQTKLFVTFVPFAEEAGAKTLRSAFSIHRIARRIISSWPDDADGWPGDLNNIKVQKAHKDEALGKAKLEAINVDHRPPYPQGHILIEKDMGDTRIAKLYLTSDLNGKLSPKASSYKLKVKNQIYTGLPGQSNVLLSLDCFYSPMPKTIKDILKMDHELLTLTDFATEMKSNGFKFSP
jgi:hypothetical protein